MTKTVEQAFEAMEWHDAVLLSVGVDRSAPGQRDEVVLAVEWLDGRVGRVRFTDCYACDLLMNFGVIGPESIRSAGCTDRSSKLAEIRQRWKRVGVDLDDLLCFEMITNSTASELRIYAKRFEISELQALT